MFLVQSAEYYINIEADLCSLEAITQLQVDEGNVQHYQR